MKFYRVDPKSLSKPRGSYVVYATNGKSTYRVRGQPRFTDRVPALDYAREYQDRWGEFTTVIYVGRG